MKQLPITILAIGAAVMAILLLQGLFAVGFSSLDMEDAIAIMVLAGVSKLVLAGRPEGI